MNETQTRPPCYVLGIETQIGLSLVRELGEAGIPVVGIAVDPDAIGVKRIVVETTDDALTTGIEKKIPWLPRIYQMGIGPDFRPAGIPLGDFKRLFSTEVR